MQYHKLGSRSFVVLLLFFLCLPLGILPTAMAADKKVSDADQLSCSKQARRVHKITDREKKRAFIAKCRADREAREKAAKEEAHRKKMAKKAKENAELKTMLNGKP